MKYIFITKPKYFNILLSIFITIFICFLLFNSEIISTIAKQNVELYLYKLLPAIFPFIFLTNILIESGIAYNLSYGLSKLVSKLFNIPKTSCPAIIMGMLLGYPNAATYLSTLHLQGKIDSNTVSKLLAYTSNANPAFILSTIGIGFYTNIQIGIILIISHFLSAIILGIVLRNVNINIIQQNTKNSYTLNKKTEGNIFNTITTSIFKSLKTLGIIFCFTVIFAIISSLICNILKLGDISTSIITATFELTNGMKAIANTSLSINSKVILSSFFLSFGSLMIIYQIYAVVHKCNISLFKFILYKIFHGILSAITSYILLMVIVVQDITIPTFSSIQSVLKYSLPELFYILAITIIMLYICFKKPKNIFCQKNTSPVTETKRSKDLTAF